MRKSFFSYKCAFIQTCILMKNWYRKLSEKIENNLFYQSSIETGLLNFDDSRFLSLIRKQIERPRIWNNTNLGQTIFQKPGFQT